MTNKAEETAKELTELLNKLTDASNEFFIEAKRILEDSKTTPEESKEVKKMLALFQKEAEDFLARNKKEE